MRAECAKRQAGAGVKKILIMGEEFNRVLCCEASGLEPGVKMVDGLCEYVQWARSEAVQ
jgi:hypothetical protein